MSRFTPNSFQITNAFVDEAMDKISDASVKIYLLIVRKTRGWGKDFDSLSLSQLESLSGKSRPTVVKCLNELVKVGLVKKHPPSVYGNVYSLIENYNIGELISFASKKSLLVRNFHPVNKDLQMLLVKNFNYPLNGKKQVKNTKILPKKQSNVAANSPSNFKDGWLINFTSKKSLLVKSFYPASKNILPLLVKIFNTQKTLSKNTNQTNSALEEKYEIFWTEYPKCKRKIRKSETFATFKKHAKHFDVLISILKLQKSSDDWIKNDGQFIPAPQSWLNQKLWEVDYWLEQLNQKSASVVTPTQVQHEQSQVRFKPEPMRFGQGLV
ncbi:MAG: replication protein [Acinetobacter sp.]|nr:replication protein [Acinetobacter sp.]